MPITSVTNGVHAATWVGPEMTAVYDRHLAPDWAHNPAAWRRVGDIGDDVLWRARARARERLVQRLRGWVRAARERRGESPATLAWTDEVFDPDALTIGFARRFAEYKRGTLLLRQPERLKALLTATDRPVQFVFAGKAHPATTSARTSSASSSTSRPTRRSAPAWSWSRTTTWTSPGCCTRVSTCG